MLHLGELLDSVDKLRLLLHQCSELFLHRHSKLLCENQTNTCGKISDKRKQRPEQQSGLTTTSARNPCTACPCGAQLPFACPPQMSWGVSSRSRKGSVCVSLQHQPRKKRNAARRPSSSLRGFHPRIHLLHRVLSAPRGRLETALPMVVCNKLASHIMSCLSVCPNARAQTSLLKHEGERYFLCVW